MAEARFGDDTRQIEILLVYEDESTGLRAKSALDQVLSRPEAGADCQFHVWKLSVLGAPVCQEQVNQDACVADIIVLAAHGDHRMSSSVEAVLNRGVAAKRSKPCALVISLDGEVRSAAEKDPALIELRRTAARNGVTVMLHFGELPPSEMNAAITDIHRRAAATSQVYEEIPYWSESTQYRHWGINE